MSIDHWKLMQQDADEYIVLFSLEYNIETMEPQLGGFLRLPKLPLLSGPEADLRAADELTGRAITRMLKEADKFLSYTNIRTRMDNKCRGPFIVHTEVKLNRDTFAEYISSLRPCELIEKFINNPQAKAKRVHEQTVTRSTLLKRGTSY